MKKQAAKKAPKAAPRKPAAKKPAKPALPAFEDPYFASVPASLARSTAPLGGLPSFLASAVPSRKGKPMKKKTAKKSALPAFEDPYFLSVPRSIVRPSAPLGGLPSFLSPSVPGYRFPKKPAAADPAADRYDWADFRAFFE